MQKNQVHSKKRRQPYWHPLVSGIALQIVLLTTFLVTGHGATGFTTRLTAWLGTQLMPAATLAYEYQGAMAENGQPLNAWITWQVIGLALALAVGAFASAWLASRFRLSRR